MLNIEGATDNSCLENRSGTKYKAVLLYIILTTVTFLIFNGIIFLLDQFQPHLPAVISITCMLVFIHSSLRTLLLKSTMVISLLRLRVFFLNFCYTVVINILPGTLKNLKKTAFFPCATTIIRMRLRVGVCWKIK